MGFAEELWVCRRGLGKRRPQNLVAVRDSMGKVTVLPVIQVLQK